MRPYRNLRVAAVLALVLALGGIVLAQRTNKILVVNGGSQTAPVMQAGGRSYVEIEALAQITNGSLKFEPNRILLTIPESPAEPAAEETEAAQKLSRGFSTAALEELARIRDWKVAGETMVQFHLPADPPWIQDYGSRAENGLQVAKVATSNDADKSAAQLLENELNTLSQWSGEAVDKRRALDANGTMGPDVLKNDQVLQKISSCADFLSSMLGGGVFSDSYSCH